jgi:hypothetical protein
MVVSYAGSGVIYAFKPGSPVDQLQLLKPVDAAPIPRPAFHGQFLDEARNFEDGAYLFRDRHQFSRRFPNHTQEFSKPLLHLLSPFNDIISSTF